MYTFRELLEIDLEESRDLVFVVNGDYFIGRICVRNLKDEWIIFKNYEAQTSVAVYINNSEELSLRKEEMEENIPDMLIDDNFEVYKCIRN
jgi:hypothetical protein